jgi:phosphomannomutase/8-oxo-dGTP pyrophosphatase MutT (NUDIX family)
MPPLLRKVIAGLLVLGLLPVPSIAAPATFPSKRHSYERERLSQEALTLALQNHVRPYLHQASDATGLVFRWIGAAPAASPKFARRWATAPRLSMLGLVAIGLSWLLGSPASLLKVVGFSALMGIYVRFFPGESGDGFEMDPLPDWLPRNEVGSSWYFFLKLEQADLRSDFRRINGFGYAAEQMDLGSFARRHLGILEQLGLLEHIEVDEKNEYRTPAALRQLLNENPWLPNRILRTDLLGWPGATQFSGGSTLDSLRRRLRRILSSAYRPEGPRIAVITDQLRNASSIALHRAGYSVKLQQIPHKPFVSENIAFDSPLLDVIVLDFNAPVSPSVLADLARTHPTTVILVVDAAEDLRGDLVRMRIGRPYRASGPQDLVKEVSEIVGPADPNARATVVRLVTESRETLRLAGQRFGQIRQNRDLSRLVVAQLAGYRSENVVVDFENASRMSLSRLVSLTQGLEIPIASLFDDSDLNAPSTKATRGLTVISVLKHLRDLVIEVGGDRLAFDDFIDKAQVEDRVSLSSVIFALLAAGISPAQAFSAFSEPLPPLTAEQVSAAWIRAAANAPLAAAFYACYELSGHSSDVAINRAAVLEFLARNDHRAKMTNEVLPVLEKMKLLRRLPNSKAGQEWLVNADVIRTLNANPQRLLPLLNSPALQDHSSSSIHRSKPYVNETREIAELLGLNRESSGEPPLLGFAGTGYAWWLLRHDPLFNPLRWPALLRAILLSGMLVLTGPSGHWTLAAAASIGLAGWLGALHIVGPDLNRKPPMSAEDATDFLIASGRLEPDRRSGYIDLLSVRQLHPGERSLHIGSGRSHLPIAEALMGLNVTILDVSPDNFLFMQRTLNGLIADTIDERGGELRMYAADVFDSLANEILNPDYDHVVAVDFRPEESREMKLALARERVDLYAEAGRQMYTQFANILGQVASRSRTVLVGVLEITTDAFFEQLKAAGLKEQPVLIDKNAFRTIEPLYLIRRGMKDPPPDASDVSMIQDKDLSARERGRLRLPMLASIAGLSLMAALTLFGFAQGGFFLSAAAAFSWMALGLKLPKQESRIQYFRGKQAPHHQNSQKELLRRLDPETLAFLSEPITREEAHETGVLHGAVHIYVLDEEGRVLLLKRPADADISPNKYQTVSGHLDFADLSPEAGALREAEEEMGIALDRSRLRRLSNTHELRRRTVSLEPQGRKDNNEATTVLFYQLTAEEKEQVIARYNTAEASQIAFMPLDELDQLVQKDGKRKRFSNTLHSLFTEYRPFLERLQFVAETSAVSFRQSFSGIRAVMGGMYFRAMAIYGYLYARHVIKSASPDHTVRLGIVRDPRPSGAQVRDALARGFKHAAAQLGQPIEIVDLGILTTPLGESAVRSLHFDGVAIITASHNPLKENGVKFTTGHIRREGDPPAGALLPARIMDQLIRQFADLRNNVLRVVALSNELEAISPEIPHTNDETIERLVSNYVEELLSLFPNTPVSDILKGYRTAVDVNGGAGAVRRLAKWTFGLIGTVLTHARIGFRMEAGDELHAELGVPTRGIEPKGDELKVLTAYLKEHGIDFGVAFDFDADRGTLAPEMDEQTVAAFNVAMRLAWMNVYDQAKGRRVVVVAHEATSKRVEEIVALFNHGREGSPIEVRRVETGEINVVTAMQQERDKGAYVPIGVEGANGGTILGEATCRDGVATQILTGLALRDPKIRAEWAARAGRPDLDPSVKAKVSLKQLAASLPQRFTPQLTKKGVPVKIQALKLNMEASFEAHWAAEPWLQKTYRSYRFEHYEETETRDHLFGDGMGGWLVVLTRKDNGREEFLWMRPSRTEPLVRYSVDAVSGFSQSRLLGLWESLYKAGIRSAPATHKFNVSLIDHLVRVAAKRSAVELLSDPETGFPTEATVIGTPRVIGPEARDLCVLFRIPREFRFNPNRETLALDAFLSQLQTLISFYPGHRLSTDFLNRKAFLHFPDGGVERRSEILLYEEDLDSTNQFETFLAARLDHPDQLYLGPSLEYLELEFYIGDLKIWQKRRDEYLAIVRLRSDRKREAAQAEFERRAAKRRALLRERFLNGDRAHIATVMYSRRQTSLAAFYPSLVMETPKNGRKGAMGLAFHASLAAIAPLGVMAVDFLRAVDQGELFLFGGLAGMFVGALIAIGGHLREGFFRDDATLDWSRPSLRAAAAFFVVGFVSLVSGFSLLSGEYKGAPLLERDGYLRLVTVFVTYITAGGAGVLAYVIRTRQSINHWWSAKASFLGGALAFVGGITLMAFSVEVWGIFTSDTSIKIAATLLAVATGGNLILGTPKSRLKQVIHKTLGTLLILGASLAWTAPAIERFQKPQASRRLEIAA